MPVAVRKVLLEMAEGAHLFQKQKTLPRVQHFSLKQWNSELNEAANHVCTLTVKYLVDTESGMDCRQVNICDPFAECIFSSQSQSYVCSCRAGFTGDGTRCMQEGIGMFRMKVFTFLSFKA